MKNRVVGREKQTKKKDSLGEDATSSLMNTNNFNTKTMTKEKKAIFNYCEKKLIAGKNKRTGSCKDSPSNLLDPRKQEFKVALAKHNSLLKFLEENRKRDLTPGQDTQSKTDSHKVKILTLQRFTKKIQPSRKRESVRNETPLDIGSIMHISSRTRAS